MKFGYLILIIFILGLLLGVGLGMTVWKHPNICPIDWSDSGDK